MNDPEINQFMESRFKRCSINKLKHFITKIRNNSDYLLLAIVLKDKNRHIGNIKIGPINRVHGFADLGIMIGEKSFWGKGLATDALKLAVTYAFNELNLHKLSAGVYADNIGSIKAFKKSGFSVEGIRKRQYLYRDNYTDSLIFGIIRK